MKWASTVEPSIPSHQNRVCGKGLVSDQPSLMVNRLVSPAPFSTWGRAGEKPKVSGSQAAVCRRPNVRWK